MILATGPGDLMHYTPLGLGSLAAYIDKTIDWAEPVICSSLTELLETDADCVGISASTQNFDVARSIARKVKKIFDVPIMLGGPHISCLPETLPEEIDFGVIGEGEKTIVVLLKALKNGKPDPDQIDGICFHRAGQVITTNPVQQIDDLDTLPVPWRVKPDANSKQSHLMTSRGCPFTCSFCSVKKIWGAFRFKSAKKVVQEITDLAEKKGIEELHIYDDLFVADRHRLSQFAGLMIESRLVEKVRLSAAVRANLVDDSLCRLLGSAQIRSVTFGAESVDEGILQKVKPGVKAEDNEKALRILSRHNLSATVSMIVGFPDQTAESMRNTYRFLAVNMAKGRLAGADVNILAPFPGTEYYRLVQNRKENGEPIEWACFGKPWHGLILNNEIEKIAAELIGYDRQMRILFSRLKRPAIVLCPDHYSKDELFKLGKLHPFRAVYRIGENSDVEIIQKGTQDIATFPAPALIKILNEIPMVPILIMDGKKSARLCEIQAALIRFDPAYDRALELRSGMKIVNSCTLMSALSEGRPFDSVAASPVELLTDPLTLLAGNAVTGGDFVALLDDHAKWIRKNPVN